MTAQNVANPRTDKANIAWRVNYNRKSENTLKVEVKFIKEACKNQSEQQDSGSAHMLQQNCEKMHVKNKLIY